MILMALAAFVVERLLGAADSSNQASLDRMKNGLSHFNPDQLRKFVCRMCNWARRHHIIRKYSGFIRNLRESTDVPFKLFPINFEDVKVITKRLCF